jgi:serine protease Do
MGKALAKPKPLPGQPAPMVDEKKPDEKKTEEKKEPETGLLKQQNAVLGREYWVYVPTTYKPDVSHGVIVWLHPTGQGGKDTERMVEIWKDFAATQHYILIGPKSQAVNGWVASETEGVVADVKAVMERYTIDRNRVIAHGMGNGGEMAFYLGFNARDVIRGVAATGSPLGIQPKDNLPTQPLRFFIVGGQKDPLIKEIALAKPALDEKRFPVVYRPIADFGKEYMDQKTLIELCIWMDSLDLL